MKKPARKSSKKRSGKRQQIIVLVDGAGNYYELPRATLERSRVSARRKKEIEKYIMDRPEEFWYIGHPTIPGSVIAPPFAGGRQLHYAGFYLSPTRSKR
jgi:hypothetical protein